jgi:ABC-type glycerol-3-phosphate transport system substrate-binding protein
VFKFLAIQTAMLMRPTHFLRSLTSLFILAAIIPIPPRLAGVASQVTRAGQAALTRQVIAAAGDKIEIGADSLGLPLVHDETAALYDKPSVLLTKGDTVNFSVNIRSGGVYTISFDAAAAILLLNMPEGRLLVDGQPPAGNAQTMAFPVFYKNGADKFPLDRYGNETLINQVQMIRWSNVPLRDVDYSEKYPIQLALSSGKHDFVFTVTNESLYLGSIYLSPFAQYPEYDQYLAEHQASDSSGVSIQLEAEFPSFKNNTAIRPVSDHSLDVTPYDTYRLLLNTLGGDSWKNSGSAVYYEVNVPEAGRYSIALHVQQNTRDNFTVFRRVTVNGSVPFEQLNEVAFGYSSSWENIILGGSTPYKIYLEKGLNVIGIEATDSPYRVPIEKIKKVLLDINTLSLQIKKLTGNQVDRYKEWNISDYIPDLQDRLIAIADDLRADKGVLSEINQNNGSQEIQRYQMAIDNILFLAQDPDKVPIYMARFSEGPGSAAQLLADLLPLLQSQPLALDKIYVYSPDVTIQQTKASFWKSLSESAKRFVASFRSNPYQSLYASPDELEVWVNRPRQYVDLLQTITDASFTPSTGIRVKFSIMPDENKLVLANAAGIQPDLALGVSTNIPFNLAVRGALYDLRSFNDFDSFIGIYSPGSLLSYIIDDSVYAIPETQDFWVTFYRKDIMDSLGLQVPKTWNEVIQILPELQRYNMNFNTPLSSGAGTKYYLFTTPYFFNYGAQLYSSDGLSTGLGSDQSIAALKFMADSFTIYGMPLTTSSFYNSFRYGTLPIGISNVDTYVKLLTGAPEIKGLWGISLYPATVLADGTQNRYTTGSAQACIMFANTEKSQQGWAFLKWWMSTETQVNFEQQLMLYYGREYLWYSANLEAFSHLPLPQEDKDVILQQWQWIQEPVLLPGSYMEEREISNAWNKIVFDGVNPRVAIDNAILTINREFRRKMQEFGYIDENGQVVKIFQVPTIETVKGWVSNAK